MKHKTIKLLSILLTLVMGLGLLPAVTLAAPITFSDVPSGAWYYKDVQKAVDSGLINGYPDNTFGPNKNMTYAEAIKLAAIMYKYSMTGSIEFEAGAPWYQPYADYAKNIGLIGKDYEWNKEATRAGYMEIFAKAIPDKPALSGMKGLTAINTVPDGSVPDVPMTHPQAAAIYKLYRAGILQGSDEQHSCMPNSNIKRSEVAAILTRMMNADERISFSMVPQTSELKITSQPKDTGIAAGKDATFTVAVSGGKAPYTYSWFRYSKKEDTTFSVENDRWFSGADTGTLITKECEATENGDRYWCVITDAAGKSVTSDKATLTVTAAAVPLSATASVNGSATSAPGGSVRVSAVVIGGTAPYTYRWVHKAGAEFSYVSDSYGNVTAADLTYTIPASSTSYGERPLYCEVTDATGKKVKSNEVTINIAMPGLRVTAQPENITVVSGNGATFTVKVDGGKAPYTYQWKIREGSIGGTGAPNDGGPFAGTKSDSFTFSDISVSENGLRVWCVITDADGNTVTSEEATLTVNRRAVMRPRP